MIKEFNIVLNPHDASDEKFYKPIVAKNLKINSDQITGIQILRRSIDARQREIKIQLRLLVSCDEETPKLKPPYFEYPDVHNCDEVIVVGAGPAGLFAALRLIEKGYRPIVLERGKSVQERRKDLAILHKSRSVNPESNYCFGEGGAGAFSDGKLYTRSKKRGNVRKIIEVFHFHGAHDNILIDAHPHIGTDQLHKIITNISQSILNAGGEIHFSTRVNDFILKDDKIKGVITQNGDNVLGKAVILATGHSARDIYYLLHKKDIEIEAKPFAVGVRIEHPQELIDQIQYHNSEGRGNYLPAASYNFACQVKERGVYSFCMCPGGIIVPAATDNNQQVVNGMSASKRNSPFANSGIVVELQIGDIKEFTDFGNLVGLKYQEKLEAMAFTEGGGNLVAPAQRMVDFVEGKHSSSLPKTSYHPGVSPSLLHKWLPKNISYLLKRGFVEFGKKSKGFLTNEAVILGLESRTSSPVRIPRERETLNHVRIEGLYPCGEGSGYAGGIVSAAMDGESCVDAFVRNKKV